MMLGGGARVGGVQINGFIKRIRAKQMLRIMDSNPCSHLEKEYQGRQMA